MFQKISNNKFLNKGILLALGVLSAVTLCLPLQIVTATVEDNKCTYYDSGFTFFRFSSTFIDSSFTAWLNIFLGCLFIIHFLFALMTIVFAIVSYFIDIKNDAKISRLLLIICSVFILLYFLTGLILYIIYTNMGTEISNGQYTEFYVDGSGRIKGQNISIQTFSYVPFLIEIIGIIALFLYDRVLVTDSKSQKELPTHLQELENLQTLRAAGILTEEEYQIQKDRILGGK